MSTQSDGFIAAPASGQGRPVLVLHAWWGLNQTMRQVCTRLAEAGFLVFAPDLYHGKTAETIPQAEALSGALDPDRAKSDIAQALAFLRQSAGPDRAVAVLGFSLGAYFALDLSNSAPDDIRSVVVFYGTGATEFRNSRASYLGHFAQSDPYEPAPQVDHLESLLREAGRSVQFHRYPDTGHWFFEPDRPDAFDAAAAALAWDRTLAFLEQTLAP